MNPDLDRLHPYPFEKLTALFDGISAADKPAIALSIGEPQHPSPAIVKDALAAQLDALAKYPTTAGLPALRVAISDWLTRRFQLQGVDADAQVLPVNGTREALFAFTQAVVDRSRDGRVLMPNPFYQIYEGAALLAGAQPHYLPCTAATGLQPDFDAIDDRIWEQTQLLFLCTPGNPTGAILDTATMQMLVRKADEHDFIIASDECYSEIYATTPPPGLLQACAEMGRHDYRRCVVFHSLSKRSNLPGLRSGFVAGDADVLRQFLRYRTYHGCAMPVHHQLASIAAWNDEQHVVQNRALYQQKFDAVLDVLSGVMDVQRPDAGFYLWPQTPVDDETFARELRRQQNVTVLPGRYLSRDVDGSNPGAGRVRMALVATLEDCLEGARRIHELITRGGLA
jgi:N-succinyldiaminopimelate aminotransferase